MATVRPKHGGISIRDSPEVIHPSNSTCSTQSAAAIDRTHWKITQPGPVERPPLITS